MSSPKEKAEELYSKYETLGKDFTRGVSMKEFAKQCALIAVNEIIKLNINDRAFISEDKDNNTIVYSTYTEYWSEVLIEITKL
jgi:hypothetical protein